MKTTAPAALRLAPTTLGRTPRSTRPAVPPSGDPRRAALATCIQGAVEGHRRRLGLAPRAYAVRRAWTLGFLVRILADPLALRLGQVVTALDGTGFAIVVARLPTEPVPAVGTLSRTLSDAVDTGPPPRAPVIRLPTQDCLCETDDACPRCA